MKVLVADKFEQSGLDGLKAAGCEVVYEPALEGDALHGAIRETGADVLIVRSTKVTEAMLEAGRAGARRPRRRRLQHHRRRRRVAPRHLRLELPGQERGGRRRADARPDPRARPPHPRQRRRAARRALEQEGVLEGARPATARPSACSAPGSIAREVVVGARARSACRSCCGAGGSRQASGPPTRAQLAGARPRPTCPTCRSRSRPRRRTSRRAADVLSVHLALTPATRGLVNRVLLAQAAARRDVRQHLARRGGRPGRARRGGDDARHPRGARRVRERAGGADRRRSPCRSSSLPGVYGTHHIGASTDQAQEAIAAETVRIVRAFKETGPRAERREPRAADAGDAHAGRPPPRSARRARARLRTPARRGNLNVQETENIVFEGAEAAVARINLDGEPTRR